MKQLITCVVAEEFTYVNLETTSSIQSGMADSKGFKNSAHDSALEVWQIQWI